MTSSAIATAWIQVLPSLEGLQSALVKASRGSVLTPSIKPATNEATGLFTKSGGILATAFGTSFDRTSKPSMVRSLGNALAATIGLGSKTGKSIGDGVEIGFNASMGPSGLNTYLKLGLVGAGIAGVSSEMKKLGGYVVGMGDDWAGVNARLQNAVGTTGDWHDALSETEESANNIGISVQDLVDQSSRLVMLAPNTIPDYSTAVKFTSLLDENMISTGASTEEAASATRQVTQALGKGIVNGDELNSIMENSPQIAQMLAKHLNVGVGELKQMGKDSKITGNDLRDAVLENAQLIEDQFNKMPMTTKRAIQAIKNDWDVNMSEAAVNTSTMLGDALKKVATGHYLKDFAANISGPVQQAAGDITGILGHAIDTIAPRLVSAFDPNNAGISNLLDMLDSLQERFDGLNADQIINGLKTIAATATIAFGAMVLGSDKAMSKIPLIGKAYVGVKKTITGAMGAVFDLESSITTMVGSGVSKVGDLLIKFGNIPKSMGLANKAIAQFNNALKDIDTSSMGKQFNDALAKVQSGSGNVTKNMENLTKVVNNLSQTARSKLPQSFTVAFTDLQKGIEDSGASFKLNSDDMKAWATNAKTQLGTIKTALAGISMERVMMPAPTFSPIENGEIVKLRQQVGEAVGSIVGIKIPDFLTEPVGAMVSSAVRQFQFFERQALVAFDAVKEHVSNVAMNVGDGFSAAMAGTSNSLSQLLSMTNLMSSSLSQTVELSFGVMAGKVVSDMQTVSHGISDGFSSAVNFSGASFSQLMAAATNASSSAIQSIAQATGVIAGEIASPFANAASGVKEGFSTATYYARGSLSEILSDAVSSGNSLSQKVGQVLGIIAGDAADKATTIADVIGEGFTNAKDAASAALKSLPSMLAEAFDIPPSVQSSLSALGDHVKSAFSTVASTGGNAVKSLSRIWPSAFGQMGRSVETLAGKFGGVGKMGKAAFSAVASASTKLAGGGIKAAGAAISGIGSALKGIGKAASNLGVTTAAVSALTGAVGTLYKTDPSQMAGALTGMTSQITSAMSTATAQLPAMATAIAQAAPGMVNAIVSMVPALVDSVSSMITTIAQAITDNLPMIMQGVTTILNSVVGMLPTILPALITALVSLVTSLAGQLPGIIQILLNGIISLLNTLPGLITDLLPGLIQSLSTMFVQIAAMLPTFATQLSGAITQIVTTLSAQLPTLLPQFVTAITTLITSIASMLPTLLPALMNGLMMLITSLASSLGQILPPIIAMIPMLITTLVNTLVAELPILINGLIMMVNALVPQIPTIITALIGAMPTVITSLVNGLTQALPELITGAIELVIMLVDNLPTIIEALINAAPQILSALGTAIVQAFPKILNAFLKGFISLAQHLPSLFVSVISAIPRIIEDFASSFKDLPGRIMDFIRSIPDKIKGLFNGAVNWLGNAGKDIIEGLKKGIMDAWNKFKGFFGKIGDWIKQHKGPPRVDKVLLVGNGNLIMNGLEKGLKQGYASVQDTVLGMNSDLQGMLTDMTEPLDDMSIRIKPQYDLDALHDNPDGIGNTYVNMPSNIIRSGEDIYTASPQMYRSVMNEVQKG